MEETSQNQRIAIGGYRLEQLLGMGPVSKTHLARRQDRAEDQVVVKIFEAVPLLALEEQDQVLEEVRLLTYLEHPAILSLLDDGLHEQMLYLVSSHAEGGSLRQRLVAAAGELLPLKEVLAILRQVGEALQFAHGQQIVHANLKPENILFQNDGRVLLADFLLPTLAKSERASRLLSTFAAFYMAPEQFHGASSPLSDQYALACLAYELLTGRPPFEADNLTLLARLHATQKPVPPGELQPARAPHVERALLKALAKRPEKRYPDIETFLADLLAPPPLEASIFSQDTLKTPAPEPLPASARPEAAVTAREDPAAALLSSSPASVAETMALIPYQPAELAVLARPERVVSRRKTWFIAALVSAAMLISFSSLLLIFRGAFPGHLQAHTSTATATFQARASSTPTAAAVTPGGTLGSIALTPTPTPAPRPSPTAHPTPTPTPGVSPTATPTPGIRCAVSYQVSSQWSGSFTANLTITNTGATTIQGWTLTFSFPSDQIVWYGWNGHFSQRGAWVSITNASFNATLAPGDSATPGFQGFWDNGNPSPTSFALNGVTCS